MMSNQDTTMLLVALVAGCAFAGALGGAYILHPTAVTTYTFKDTLTSYRLTFYPTAIINATVTKFVTANVTNTIVTTSTNVTTSTSYYVSTVTTTVTTTA